jgi:hypothetical protein
VVFLRRRTLAPPDDQPANQPLQSGRLRVSGAPSSPDTLVLEPLDPFPAADAAKFPLGSVVFLPARAKAGTPEAGQVLTLVAPAIVSHISTTHGPLDAPKATPERACVAKPELALAKVTPENLPDPLPPTIAPLVDLGEIVGLYEGGGNHGCGVYHPAGTCTFRGGEGTNDFRAFCRVCRYVLVDVVDPSKHRFSDDAYALFYPGPEHES